MAQDLKNLCFEELRDLVAQLGIAPYRAKQISQWVFQKNVASIDEMTNISKDLRARLRQAAFISELKVAQTALSRDGSKKFVFKTADGYGIESVLIPEKNHCTLCISTQIGCAIGCRFCHTGHSGLVRNLSPAEIVNQVSAVLKAEPFEERLPNIVFMGMGEPLANYENTVKSIRMLLSSSGFNFSHRKITVSTAGLIPAMQKLGQDLPVNLAISLNAPSDAVRNRLMPINKKYPIGELLAAARRFPLPTRKRITFEYILIRGINDSEENARELARRLKNIPCKINLIPFNAHPAVSFEPPAEGTVRAFQAVLHELNFTAPVRRSKGPDIAAACGQLGAGIQKS